MIVEASICVAIQHKSYPNIYLGSAGFDRSNRPVFSGSNKNKISFLLHCFFT